MDKERDPSPEQEARFKERLAEEVSKVQAEKRRAAKREGGFGKMGRRAAMVALLVVIVAGTTLSFASEAFAGGVSHFFTRLLQGGEELRITEKENAGFELNMADFVGMYIPVWIPNGYRGVDLEITSDIKSLSYENKEGDSIRYYIYTDSRSVAIDNEDVTETPVFIHDSWGKSIVKDGNITIVWEDAEFIYVLTGSEKIESELKKVAENTEKVSMED